MMAAATENRITCLKKVISTCIPLQAQIIYQPVLTKIGAAAFALWWIV
jgi:hypothetical protein